MTPKALIKASLTRKDEMTIHREFEQNSLQWLQARCGLATASDFDSLVTPKWKVREGEMVASYVALKVAERWTGGIINDIGSWAMEQGHLLEDEGIPWAEVKLDQDIERVALITSDCGRFGCSPDGIIGERQGVEMKCLQPVHHTKLLLNGKVPDEYLPQIQGGMFVTGWESWRFIAYSKRFPKLILTVERDAKAQEAIAEALALFCARVDLAYERLVALNGGPPYRSEPAPKPAPESNPNDVPH